MTESVFFPRKKKPRKCSQREISAPDKNRRQQMIEFDGWGQQRVIRYGVSGPSKLGSGRAALNRNNQNISSQTSPREITWKDGAASPEPRQADARALEVICT